MLTKLSMYSIVSGMKYNVNLIESRVSSFVNICPLLIPIHESTLFLPCGFNSAASLYNDAWLRIAGKTNTKTTYFPMWKQFEKKPR